MWHELCLFADELCVILHEVPGIHILSIAAIHHDYPKATKKSTKSEDNIKRFSLQALPCHNAGP